MSNASEDPRVGELLQGRYRIQRKLGEGGMGAVYAAQHEMIGRRVAIKTLHPHYAQNPEIVERFHREANAATAIGNEHIIEVTDYGAFPDGAPYLVMEYLEGVELGELLEREGSLPIARVVHIVTQVCSALAAAHARGIVHRDMKPENIYLIRRSHDPDFVKVLDFGISKVRASEEDLKGGGLTKTGMALGTPYFMPPEQAQGLRDVDHRVDVYALGVILYRMLAGRLPFDAETYPALMVKIMTETPLPLRKLRGDVPHALEQIVHKAMAKERAERFQSVEELAYALQPFAALDMAPHMLASLRPQPLPGTPMSATPFVASNLPSQPPQGAAATPSAAPADASMAKLAVFAGIALAAIGVAAVIWVASNGRAPAPAATAPAAYVQPQPPPGTAAPQPSVGVAAAAPAQVAAAQEPKPAEVRVRIAATPERARIFIGDVEFPNPTDAFRPRSLDPVRVRVQADGHQAVEQLAIFDQDRELRFELVRGAGTRELSALSPGQNARRAGPATSALPAAAPTAPAQAAVEPKAAAPEPGKPPSEEGLYKGPTGQIRSEF